MLKLPIFLSLKVEIVLCFIQHRKERGQSRPIYLGSWELVAKARDMSEAAGSSEKAVNVRLHSQVEEDEREGQFHLLTIVPPGINIDLIISS